MRWWMNSSRSTSPRPALLALAGLFLALAGPALVSAQGSLEERYQRALDLFNTGKVEDACEQFQSIQKENPGYKETSTYANVCGPTIKQMYDTEEKLFNEGVALFKQGQLDDAKQKFQQVVAQNLKKPKYKSESQQYLQRIDRQLGEEARFQEAVKLFNDGKDTDARTRFNQIIQAGGGRVAEARDYLKRIDDRREESAFREAERAFTGKDYRRARQLFEEVVRLKGNKQQQAQQYLARIDADEREETAYNQAVRDFQQKRYDAAKNGFQQVVGLNGAHKAEAQDFVKQIDAVQREEDAFQQAVKLFDQKNFDAAKSAFERVVQMRGQRASDARTYLVRVRTRGQDPQEVTQNLVKEAEAARAKKNFESALDRLKAAAAITPGDRAVQRLLAQVQTEYDEDQIRQGLKAYFEGNFEMATRLLTSYLENDGRKRELAHFFRGASHGARYFLSGEQDAQQKQLALADFDTLHRRSNRFRPPEKFIPPKILALFAETAENR